jgi:hypothetical protein
MNVGTEPQTAYLQPLWDTMLGHADLISSPLFNIAVPVGWYIVLCLVFTVLDFQTAVQKYKIQRDKPGWPWFLFVYIRQ